MIYFFHLQVSLLWSISLELDIKIVRLAQLCKRNSWKCRAYVKLRADATIILLGTNSYIKRPLTLLGTISFIV
jgi:hypothetical protein